MEKFGGGVVRGFNGAKDQGGDHVISGAPSLAEPFLQSKNMELVSLGSSRLTCMSTTMLFEIKSVKFCYTAKGQLCDVPAVIAIVTGYMRHIVR